MTFRLADSIPRMVLEQWLEERRAWYAMWGLDEELSAEEYSSRYLSIPRTVRMAFERQQIVKPLHELDKCHGSCIFRKKEYAEVLQSALQYFDHERLQCGDFVIMPNHVHWIVMPFPSFDLEKIMKTLKGVTSREVGKLNGDLRGHVWQAETYDRCIRDRDELVRIRRYIQRNPMVARLSENEYTYYRADWLDG